MTVARRARTLALAALAAAALVESRAGASNPLEYPDNGSASFSRGGAWLAVANEPIATHYNPAGLATMSSGVSVEQQLAFPHTCFEREGPDGAAAGPNDGPTRIYEYRRACSQRRGFPNAIPSFAIAWRAARTLGFGLAVVPPAAYGTAEGQFPALARGFDEQARKRKALPAPYRYLELDQHSTVLFPTASVGYEIARGLRVGAGFVAGIGVIDVSTAAVSQLGTADELGDHMTDDSLSRLRTEDLFVPGVVVGLHWSLGAAVDVAAWGRYLDAIRTSHGALDVTQQPFDRDGGLNPPCAGAPGPNGETTYSGCSANQSVPNHFEKALTRFVYPIPPEVRVGVRVHLPRPAESRLHVRNDPVATIDPDVRDPLHDDVFDVELDCSYTRNSVADVIQVRFRSTGGEGALVTNPTSVPVPPNADRPTGFRDSFGARLGGQWNVVPDLLGLRVGAWMESRSQDPAFLTIDPVGATRYGLGGGAVVRYRFVDVSVGYQRHLSEGLDNHGRGRLRAPAAVGANSIPFDPDADPAGVGAAERTTFRTIHAVNGGRVSFDAHVFTLGAVARF